MSRSRSGHGPGPMPEEEPAIPLEPAVAKARSAFIRNSYEKIKKLQAEGKSLDEIKKEVNSFFVNYPAAFKMITTPNFNEASFQVMLAMLERMGKGEMTQDQASGVVGQRLYNTYIKPNIDESKENGEAP